MLIIIFLIAVWVIDLLLKIYILRRLFKKHWFVCAKMTEITEQKLLTDKRKDRL